MSCDICGCFEEKNGATKQLADKHHKHKINHTYDYGGGVVDINTSSFDTR